MRSSFLFLILIVGLSGLVFSCSEDPITPNQELAISGTVYDEDTDSALRDCRVTIISTFVFVKTDSLGRFAFDSLDFRENYSLRIEKSGYEDQIITLSFTPDGISERDIEVRLSLDRANNNEPELPTLIFPISNASEVMVNPIFRWTAATMDEGDDIRYRLNIYSNDNPAGRTFETMDTFFEVTNLAYSTRYFWQVEADDQINSPSTSSLGTFVTLDFPEYRVHFVRVDEQTGNFVVFAGETPNLLDQSIVDSLAVVQLTDASVSSWRPHLNTAAKKVAFLSFVGAETHLFTMDQDGSNITQVTNNKPVTSLNLLEVNYAWSPNGGALVYPHKDKIYRINENGTGLTALAIADTGFFFTEVDWSNNGLIAARMQTADRYTSKIVLYQEDGSIINTLVDGKSRQKWIGGPVLSKEGDFVYFSEDREDEQFPDELPRRSWILRTNLMGAVERVNDEPIDANTSDLMPTLPAGGELIMFENRASNHADLGDIYAMEVRLNGEDVTRMVVFRNATMPDWQ